MSPADELRAAATRLEEAATGVTPGPWRARYTDRYGYAIPDPAEDWADGGEGEGEFNLLAGTALPVSRNGDEERDSGHYEPQHVIAEYDDHDSPGQDRERWANLQWAALVNPQVAPWMVSWLQAESVAADIDLRSMTEPEVTDRHRHPLGLARVINGITS